MVYIQALKPPWQFHTGSLVLRLFGSKVLWVDPADGGPERVRDKSEKGWPFVPCITGRGRWGEVRGANGGYDVT